MSMFDGLHFLLRIITIERDNDTLGRFFAVDKISHWHAAGSAAAQTN